MKLRKTTAELAAALLTVALFLATPNRAQAEPFLYDVYDFAAERGTVVLNGTSLGAFTLGSTHQQTVVSFQSIVNTYDLPSSL